MSPTLPKSLFSVNLSDLRVSRFHMIPAEDACRTIICFETSCGVKIRQVRPGVKQRLTCELTVIKPNSE